MQKMTKIGFFELFSAVMDLVRELIISNMHNKFEQYKWKTC